MHATALRRPILPVAVAAALMTALLVLLPARSASAHDQLIGSDPASDSTVETLPDEISLSFSAALIDAPEGTAIVVTDESGRVVSTGDAELDGAIVRQGLDAAGSAAGEYTVQWAVVSSDGHPTDGEFVFTVENGQDPSEASPAPTGTEGAEEPATEPPQEATTAPVADDPNMESGFSLSVPWIIGISVVVLIVLFLVIVLVSRRRSPQHPDSDAPTER